MKLFVLFTSWALAGLGFPSIALAQIGSTTASPAPLVTPPVPTELAYPSAFDDYRPYREQALGSWRDANDRVLQAGGWRAYAREVQADSPPPVPKASSPGGSEK